MKLEYRKRLFLIMSDDVCFCDMTLNSKRKSSFDRFRLFVVYVKFTAIFSFPDHIAVVLS